MQILHLSRTGLWLRFKSGTVFAINQHGWAIHYASGGLRSAANFPCFWRVIDFDPPQRGGSK